MMERVVHLGLSIQARRQGEGLGGPETTFFPIKTPPPLGKSWLRACYRLYNITLGLCLGVELLGVLWRRTM